MKVLLIEDVYNLGRAGDIKKVANGYGRNFLLPQGLAVLATPSALAQVERIREEADKKRTLLNAEMSVVAEKMEGILLKYAARAGETGKLYGSVTTMMIANTLTEDLGAEISKRQIDSQPLRLLGMHKVKVRLTVDLIPEIDVVIFREGEPVENYMVDAEQLFSEAEAEIAAEEGYTPEEEPAVEAETEAVEEDVEETAEEAAEEATEEAAE